MEFLANAHLSAVCIFLIMCIYHVTSESCDVCVYALIVHSNSSHCVSNYIASQGWSPKVRDAYPKSGLKVGDQNVDRGGLEYQRIGTYKSL